MRKQTAILLMLFLLAGFCGATLALRLPSAAPVSVRAGRSDSEQTLIGGDEVRTALELLPGERLDLNAADAEALQKLPGIGPALAEAIIDYRAEHGPFAAKEDVAQVPGIGPARYAAIEDSITVEETP